MKKKEFSIGEKFQLGLTNLTVKQGDDCGGCWFAENNIIDCNALVGACDAHSREDKTNVTFKELEE